jgi:integrase
MVMETMQAEMLANRKHFETSLTLWKGFFPEGSQHLLYESCSQLWFRGAVEMARLFGWRISEVKGLRVSHVDFEARTIRLDGSTTRNGEPRVVTMPNDLFLLLEACALGKGPDDYICSPGQITNRLAIFVGRGTGPANMPASLAGRSTIYAELSPKT